MSTLVLLISSQCANCKVLSQASLELLGLTNFRTAPIIMNPISYRLLACTMTPAYVKECYFPWIGLSRRQLYIGYISTNCKWQTAGSSLSWLLPCATPCLGRSVSLDFLHLMVQRKHNSFDLGTHLIWQIAADVFSWASCQIVCLTFEVSQLLLSIGHHWHNQKQNVLLAISRM